MVTAMGRFVNAERYTTERNLRSTKLTQDAPPDFKTPADTSDLQAHGKEDIPGLAIMKWKPASGRESLKQDCN